MVGEVGGVVLGAVDEARLAAAEERRPEVVHAGGVDDAAVVAQAPGAVEHRQLEPGEVGPEARCPHDACSSRRDRGRGSAGHRRPGASASKRSGASDLVAELARPRSTRRSRRAAGRASGRRGRSGCRGRRRTAPRRLGWRRRRPRSCTPASVSRLRSSVRRSAVPTSCGDATPRARRISSHLVVALVEPADGLHPVLDVAAPVGPRHPHVLAHRDRHRSARRVDLLGQLDAGGRRAHDQHPALRQLVRMPVLQRVHRHDAVGHGRRRTPARRGAGDAPVAITTHRHRHVPSSVTTS